MMCCELQLDEFLYYIVKLCDCDALNIDVSLIIILSTFGIIINNIGFMRHGRRLLPV